MAVVVAILSKAKARTASSTFAGLPSSGNLCKCVMGPTDAGYLMKRIGQMDTAHRNDGRSYVSQGMHTVISRILDIDPLRLCT